MVDGIENVQAKKRRARSPHPGVKFKRPDPSRRMEYWRAVYSDPDSGRETYERLDPAVYPTERARLEWAKRKSREIANRREELANGASRATGQSFEKVFDIYFSNTGDLRPATVKDYKVATGAFLRWAADGGITPDKLTRANLVEYRSWAYSHSKSQAAVGGKRGAKREAGRSRSAATVNGDLRVMRRVLGWLRATDRLPRCSLEDLKIALAKYREQQETPAFLTPEQLRRLFEAAERHDAAVYTMTRREKADALPGQTARYTPISPLVAGVLLTGMRLDEACLIEWGTHVFLDALDHDAREVGEIRLRAQDTKTHRARAVILDVSPLCRELLLALKRRSKGRGPVFGVTYDECRSALRRLRDDHGAPSIFDWQTLRSTCSTYLTNAPAIYGSAAPFRAAKQLGHSVKVAESNYAGIVRGISHEHRTLEAAMQIEQEVRSVIARVTGHEVAGNVVRLNALGARS